MPMSMTFETFKQECEDRGYEPRKHENKIWYIFSNNGIKCEIKVHHYTVGWSSKLEDMAEIRKRLLDVGFTEKKGKRSEKRKDEKDFMNIPFDGDVSENFWVIVGIIESIESIVKKVRGQAIKPIAREVSEPVSYTHLTLPTIYSVQISVVAVSLKKKKNT